MRYGGMYKNLWFKIKMLDFYFQNQNAYFISILHYVQTA